MRTARQDYLQYEPIQIEVGIKNSSDQPLLFANESDSKPWLSFIVLNSSGIMVDKDEPFMPPPITIGVAKKEYLPVNLTPHYLIRDTGQFKIRAVVRTPDKQTLMSSFLLINIGKGDVMWKSTRSIGPLKRDYSLLRFLNNSETMLFIRVEEPQNNIVYATHNLGPLSLGMKDSEIEFDQDGILHILNPTAPSSYLYTRVGKKGEILETQIRDALRSLPRLVRQEDGSVKVFGGMPRGLKTPREKLSDLQTSPTLPQPEPAPAPPDMPDILQPPKK